MKRETATAIAWVSGYVGDGYTLHVARVPATRDFRALDCTPFDKFRAAQDIANAIRASVHTANTKGAKR